MSPLQINALLAVGPRMTVPVAATTHTDPNSANRACVGSD